MDCPACGSALRSLDYRGLTLDRCTACKGIWYDEDELGAFLSAYLADHPDLPPAKLTLASAQGARAHRTEGERSCPRCSFPLEKHNYSYDSGIILDRCHACGGVWADATETEALARYVKGHPKLDRLADSMAAHVRDSAERNHDLHVAGDAVACAWLGLAIPYADDTPKKTIPVFTYALILTNTCIMLWLYYGLRDWSSVFDRYSMKAADVTAGRNWETLLTAMFLHAGMVHLCGNMLFLWIFGDNVEDRIGHFRFLLFYVAVGIAASLAYILLHADTTRGCIGASGAISGVIGAYIVFYPRARLRILIPGRCITIAALWYVLAWFAFQLASTLTAIHGGGGIAFSAHVGGFIAGVVFASLHTAITRASLKIRQ